MTVTMEDNGNETELIPKFRSANHAGRGGPQEKRSVGRWFGRQRESWIEEGTFQNMEKIEMNWRAQSTVQWNIRGVLLLYLRGSV